MSAALDAARTRLRETLGPYGLWRRGGVPIDFATEAERLAVTQRLVVATGIVNIWTAEAGEVADSYHRIEAAHPGRFILGIGPGHPERVEQAARPYGPLVDYLDALEARGVPATRLVLAALGDRILRLSAERALGAHPYFVTPAHAVRARSVLGPSPLLVPEVRVALEADPAAARARLRPGMRYYFELANYRNNLLRLGVAEEMLDPERDDAIDLLAVHGDAGQVRARVDAHLAAGADHVLLQLVPADEAGLVDELRRLGAALGLG